MHFYGASLTHAHTCAYVSPFFFHDKEALFYETSQPGECGVWFDSHSCSLFRQLCTGELVTQRIEEGVTVGIGPMADRDAFFEALGIQFTRAQLLEQATTMGIKPNTALTWLKRLVKQGLIVNLDGKGTYAHARVCVC